MLSLSASGADSLEFNISTQEDEIPTRTMTRAFDRLSLGAEVTTRSRPVSEKC